MALTKRETKPGELLSPGLARVTIDDGYNYGKERYSDDGSLKVISSVGSSTSGSLKYEYPSENGRLKVLSSQQNKNNNDTTITTTPNNNSNKTNEIKLNEEKINTFINKIEQSIDMLNSTWNNLVMTDVQKINDSWASNDAKTYVDKLMAEGDKISDIVLALKLLEETYKKVINESTATGQDVSGSVGRL